MSFATVTTSKMELSPMRVTYNGIDLGGTTGSVVVAAKYAKSDILADQSGSTVRDRRVSGIEITVTTNLAEVQDKSLWKVVFPHATLTGSGTSGTLEFFENMGDSDLANAATLILHPLSKADGDTSGDIYFYKAVASAESSITYGPTEQAVLSIVWNILPDESVQPNQFMRIGEALP